MKQVEKIDFNNQINPKSRLDVVAIEEILKKQTKEHSPYQFHIIKFYTLFIVTEGVGKHFIDFESYECTKGTVLFIGNGQVHKFMRDSGLKGYLLPFHDDYLSFLSMNEITKILQLFNTSLFEPKIQLDKQTFLEMLNRISTINNEYIKVNDSYSSNIIRGELFTIFSIFYRIKSLNNKVTLNTKHIKKFILFQELLRENIVKTSKVEDYAKEIGMSSKTLNTITKSITGKQAKTYINEFYILEIKRMLTDQTLSIKECAFQLGFDDIPNFYKFFKHHLNLTPEQFRQQYC